MSSISLFDVISVVFSDPKIFLYIPASAAHAAAVNPKGIKTILANGIITFFINGNPVFNNGPINLPEIHLIVSSLIIGSSTNQQMNYLQKIYEDSKLVRRLIIIYEEN